LPKPLNAVKKPFEARVTLLSRYSFSQKNSLLRTLAYPLIHTPLDANLRILLEMSAGPAQKNEMWV
jgi:hypothetical protein